MLMSVLSAHAFGDVYLHLGHDTHISMASGCCLTARLTACALNANAADTMAWHPYNTVVDTILQVTSCLTHCTPLSTDQQSHRVEKYAALTAAV